jgi:carbamoyltransferase
MGLAPYGQPRFLDAMRKLVTLRPDGGYELALRFFRHHREIEGTPQWIDGSPEVGDLVSPELEKLLGPRRSPDEALTERHHDIARSAQAMYEEAFFHLLRTLQKRTMLTDLALAGGCAMNSVANGKVRRETGASDASMCKRRPLKEQSAQLLPFGTSSVAIGALSWIMPIGGRNSAKRKSPA